MNSVLYLFKLCLALMLLCISAWAGAAENMGSAHAVVSYEVKSGETLDHVIRKTMGDSPLKIEILRQAFIDQNPQAFTKSSPRALMAGAILQIPDHDNLMQIYLGSGRALTHSVKKSDSSGFATTDLDMNERKNWVRFP
jgi:Tfp pilus assembly protein FimV